MYKTEQDLARVISLGKPIVVIEHFAGEYLQGIEKDAWTETMKAEHTALFPELIDGEPIYDTDETTILGYEQIDNPAFVSFGDWLNEEAEVQIGTRDVYDVDGITVIGTEPVMEMQKVRPYVEVPIDIASWKLSSPLYATYKKGLRARAVEELQVAVNAVPYDADEKAQDRMSRVLSVANFKFNQAIALGMTPADAYTAIYKSSVYWKGADNLAHSVQVESIAEATELGLNDLAALWEQFS